jgi:alkylated DNA repair protein alkB homolog 8
METIYTQNNESSDMDLKKIKEQKKKEKQAIKLVQKAKKKLVQMTTTLPNLENKSLEQLFTTTPTANVLLAHFGTGSQ